MEQTMLKFPFEAKPEEILRQAGIEITQPDFFEKGIQKIKQDLDFLEEKINYF